MSRAIKINLSKITENNYFVAIIVLFISVCIFAKGYNDGEKEIALFGVLLFWCYGMIYGMLSISKLYGYTIMNFMLFVFFLSRPTLAFLYETDWTTWENGIVEEALLLVFISEVALFLGCCIVKHDERVYALEIKESIRNIKLARCILLAVILITGVLTLYSSMKNYYRYSGLAYEELYVSSAVGEHALVRMSSTFFPYAVFAYLATLPPKKTAVITAFVYIVLGIPTFLLGNRANLVLNVAVVVVYFFMRDHIGRTTGERWINRPLKIGFVAFIALAIVFLGAFNYYRSGLDPTKATNIPIMADFFYRQGTTFDTVCQGLQYQEDIMKIPHEVGYSIGTVYDTVKHSTLSQVLLGTTSLGSGNSINMVMNSNNLAHKLSYIVLGEERYLAGFGRGSSYILELFYDGGFLLVAIFSAFLGVYLANLNKLIQNGKWFANFVIISTLPRVFYIPRSATFGFITFLFTPHFWIIVALILCFRGRITRKKRIKRTHAYT